MNRQSKKQQTANIATDKTDLIMNLKNGHKKEFKDLQKRTSVL